MRPSFRILAVALLVVVAPPTVYAQSTWREASELPPGPSTLLWGSRINIDNNSCCGDRQTPSEEEARLIESLRDRASRDGPVLSLSLAGKRAIRLVDSNTHCADDMCRAHKLTAYWPAQGYYVVEVTLFEGRQAYLISEREGRTTLVFAPPVLSPSGRYAIAWDYEPAY